eukprot:TRINITY_DN16925_c2_g1_i1.p1 TRINITY_DN16925_c2_g1~~TRINITY_DN16925_c2_g1_i1.p1  ORF type:complete len:860 (-),score=117.82 TRINITY_DN16925_c2_g1_i1:164-2743(-)
MSSENVVDKVAGAGGELLAKMRQRSASRAHAGSVVVVQVERGSPTASNDIFRSGWSRPPQVTAPLNNGVHVTSPVASLSPGKKRGFSMQSDVGSPSGTDGPCCDETDLGMGGRFCTPVAKVMDEASDDVVIFPAVKRVPDSTGEQQLVFESTRGTLVLDSETSIRSSVGSLVQSPPSPRESGKPMCMDMYSSSTRTEGSDTSCIVGDRSSNSSCNSSSIHNGSSGVNIRDDFGVKCCFGSVPEHTVPHSVHIHPIDANELDARFDVWFDSGRGMPVVGRNISGCVRASLAQALDALWQTVASSCATCSTDGAADAIVAVVVAIESLPVSGGEAAVGAVTQIVDDIILEFLKRIKIKLEMWLVNSEPTADEIADVAGWLIFEVSPSLLEFDRRVAAVSNNAKFIVKSWRHVLDGIDRMLLGAWEAVSCDEVCQRVESLYAETAFSELLSPDMSSAPESKFSFGQCHGSPRSEGRTESSRADSVLAVLWSTARLGAAWQDHPAACDRAAAVLVAALSSVVRSFRKHVLSSLLSPPGRNHGVRVSRLEVCETKPVRKCGLPSLRQASRRVSSKIAEAARHSFPEFPGGICVAGVCCGDAPLKMYPSADVIAAIADESAQLAAFCWEAKLHGGPVASAVRSEADVFAVFGFTFQEMCAQVCQVLAEVHFAPKVGDGTASQACFNRAFVMPRSGKETSSAGAKGSAAAPTVQRGAMEEACRAAGHFLDENLSHCSPLCGRLACDAVSRIILRHWARTFCRSATRLRSCRQQLLAIVAADERSLDDLAVRWHFDSVTSPPSSGALLVATFEETATFASSTAEVFRGIRAMLLCKESIPANAATIQEALGPQQCSKLFRAVRGLVV